MSISNVFELLSGVALFLFGMSLMGDSLKKVAGNKLELILYRLSSTPIKGILLGTGVTSIIQSSCATSVMVVGFVNSNMMKLRQAIGVIMGAIIGTSITGWIICLSQINPGAGGGWLEIISTNTLTACIAVAGVIMRMFSKNPFKKNLADVFLGFATLMIGISTMSAAVYPLRESPEFINAMTTFSNPILGIVIGAAITAVLQSASAAVGILQALAITGAINFDIAFPVIMGIAIGASVPVVLSGLGASTDAKRAAFSYLYTEIVGVVVFSILFFTINHFVDLGFDGMVMTAVSIALLNSVFRAINIAILAPFIKPISNQLCRIIKSKPGEEVDLSDFDRLEDRFLDHPALAIEQSRTTVNNMALKAKENIQDAFSLVYKYTDDGFSHVKMMEDIIDRYEDKLGTYLVKITSKELTTEQSDNVTKYLRTINDFERISDHALNIAECGQEISQKDIHFSDTAVMELKVLSNAVAEILELAVESFVNDDLETAFKVEPLEETIDDLCDELKAHHIERIGKGECTYEHGFVFNDLLTNFERVGDHCSNIALATIELDSDSFDTHEYVESITKFHNENFEEAYKEYSRKYKI